MGFGLKLATLKCDVQFPSSTNVPFSACYPCSWLPSRYPLSVRGAEISINATKLSYLSIFPDACDINNRDNSKMQFQEGIKAKIATKSPRGVHDVVEAAMGASQFGLLLENLNILEDYVADSNAVKLEKDILLQLRRLGALELFKACLSKTLERSVSDTSSHVRTMDVKKYLVNQEDGSSSCSENNLMFVPNIVSGMDKEECVNSVGREGKVMVQTRKKQRRLSARDRILRRERAATRLSWPSQTMARNVGRKTVSVTDHGASTSKGDVLKFAKREAEISRGIKAISELERMWTILEKETGQVPTLNSWAEASKLDKQTLQQKLRFGWYCRDELIKSTRTLILFLAKGYKGFGVAVEDLLQAGYIGVLQGAERFDHSKGYRFSTYVRYWILKSISTTVSRNTRGIELPSSLTRAVRKITSARRTLRSIRGRAPCDKEIADFTGLTVANVEAASKCPRFVASIDEKLGEGYNAKYMEFIQDTSIHSPEEAVARQHIRRDIHCILKTLEPREREVLLLRFGFGDHRPKSLEEIGRVFQVSKEWVRRLEKRVLTKILKENGTDLIHYTTM